jgi:hypothetical protein
MSSGETAKPFFPGTAQTRSGASPTITGSVALELADDEGDEIGRHLHGIGKNHFLFTALGQDRFAHHCGVGDRRKLLIDHESDLIDRLERRLVPAGERPARVRRFELRRGEALFLTVLVFVRAAVKAVQLVVEYAGKLDVQFAGPGGSVSGKLNSPARSRRPSSRSPSQARRRPAGPKPHEWPARRR